MTWSPHYILLLIYSLTFVTTVCSNKTCYLNKMKSCMSMVNNILLSLVIYLAFWCLTFYISLLTCSQWMCMIGCHDDQLANTENLMLISHSSSILCIRTCALIKHCYLSSCVLYIGAVLLTHWASHRYAISVPCPSFATYKDPHLHIQSGCLIR